MFVPSYKNLTAAGTTTSIAPGPAVLVGVTVNTAAASSTVTIYDNTAASGNKIATIDSSQLGNFSYFVRAKKGITVVIAGGNPDITLSYT